MAHQIWRHCLLMKNTKTNDETKIAKKENKTLKALDKQAHKLLAGNLLTRYAPYDVIKDQAIHMELAKTEAHSNDDQKRIVIIRGGLAGQMAEDVNLFNFVISAFLYEVLKEFKLKNELTDVEIRATIQDKKNKYFEYNQARDTYNLTFRLTGLSGETMFELP